MTHLFHSTQLRVFQEPKPPGQDQLFRRWCHMLGLWQGGGAPWAAESVPALPTAQSTPEPPGFRCVGCRVCAWLTARAMQMSVTPHWRIYSSEARSKWANLSIFCDGCPGSWQRTGSLHLASSTGLHRAGTQTFEGLNSLCGYPSEIIPLCAITSIWT